MAGKKIAKPVRSMAILHHGDVGGRIATSMEHIGFGVRLPDCCKPHGCEIIPVIIADARHYNVTPKPARKQRRTR